VLLVDDHAVVREGYRRLLERCPEIVVVGEAASAMEAYRKFCELQPDVVIMDISLPDVSGVEAIRRLQLRDASVRILVFSIHDEAIFPKRAFQAGARGYVTKASAPEVLVDAVRSVAKGEVFLSADVAQTLALHTVLKREDALRLLSDREFEILRLVAEGHSLQDIAERLSLAYKTIANYQSIIKQKLGVDTSVQLIRFAAENGLLAPDR
jgi:DNA-binding NarL/FixJ family response regulator